VLCCGFQSNVAASNAKLALFYDWFFFDAEKDSIMNIGTVAVCLKINLLSSVYFRHTASIALFLLWFF